MYLHKSSILTWQFHRSWSRITPCKCCVFRSHVIAQLYFTLGDYQLCAPSTIWEMETFEDNQSKDIGRDTAGVSGESVVCLPCQHFCHSGRSEAQAPCLSNQSVNYQYFKKTWCSLVSYFGAFEVSMLCQPGTRMAIGTGSHHLDLVDFVQQHQPPPSRGHHHPRSVPGQKV